MIYRLYPALSKKIWGGNKLNQIFNPSIKDKIGEAWIMSCLGANSSLTDQGVSLLDIFLKNKDIVRKGYQRDFPLLIKLIDANDDLSIQVHPEVKTEFWHILSLNPSKLYMGFKKDSSKDEVFNSLSNNTITDLLNYIDVKAGDSYLIKPGTIHAIGKGTFLIEIQRSADVTYRLYDFNRVDKDGHKRELHITDALKVIDYHKLEPKQDKNNNLLVSCPYFHVYRYYINGEKSFIATDKSFHALTIVNGNATIKSKTQTIKAPTFTTIFVPANEGEYTISGNCDVILTTL